ncbi:MAG: hemolysin family protein [Nitrospinaceae bacterium]
MEFTSTLIFIFIGIAMEAFFSGSEIGMISINRIKIQQKVDEGHKGAQLVLDLLSTPEDLFATTSLGTNFAVMTSTAVFTAYMVTHFGEPGEVMAMVIISPVILFAGEIVPKIILQSRADSIMPILIYPLKIFYKVFLPIINFFTGISKYFTQRFKILGQENTPAVSREQIRQVLSLDSQTIELDPTERKMIHRIFNFGEITVEQCMVPLVQIDAINDSATLEEANEMANESGFSRLPVFHERMYNLIGILNTFDLLNQPADHTPISDLIRPAYYVPPNKKIDDLLKELQQRGLHMALVVDEYGGCIGLVTIEDLLEEIVGEIEDEYDKPEQQYESYADGGYLIDADMEVDAINETLDLNLPTGDYETLGGLIIDQLEKIPHSGEQITVDGNRLTVKEAGKRKVYSVIVRKLPPSPQEETPQDKGSD